MALSQLLCGWGTGQVLDWHRHLQIKESGLESLSNKKAGTPLALPRRGQPQTSRETCSVGSFCPQTFLQKKEDNMLMQRRPAGRTDSGTPTATATATASTASSGSGRIP